MLTVVLMMPRTLLVYLPFLCIEASDSPSLIHWCGRLLTVHYNGNNPQKQWRSLRNRQWNQSLCTFPSSSTTHTVSVGLGAAEVWFASQDQSRGVFSSAVGTGLPPRGHVAITSNGPLPDAWKDLWIFLFEAFTKWIYVKRKINKRVKKCIGRRYEVLFVSW